MSITNRHLPSARRLDGYPTAWARAQALSPFRFFQFGPHPACARGDLLCPQKLTRDDFVPRFSLTSSQIDHLTKPKGRCWT